MMQKLAVVLILLVLFIWGDAYYQSVQPPKELERFEAQFYMKMPQDAGVVFSERDYGWMGDGHLLYIYQLNAGDMEAFLQQGALNGWSELPVSKKWGKELEGSIDTFFSAEAKAEMNLKSRRGYYIVKNNTDPFREKQNYAQRAYEKERYGWDYDLLNNVAVGMVDLVTNKVYFYKWDT